MNKSKNIIGLCQSYRAKIGGRDLGSSKLQTASGRRVGLLSILACSVLLFVNCPDPQQMAQKETEIVYDVSLLAGSSKGYMDGSGSAAQFDSPNEVAVGSDGTVYVADTINNRLREITPAGVVSLLAGSTAGYNDATGIQAQFSGLTGVAVDSAGTVYVADTVNNRLRKITPAGEVSLLAGSAGDGGYADGTGAAAKFFNPSGIAVGADDTVYVADTANHRIRKITPAGEVSLLAGSTAAGYKDGTAAEAQFTQPYGVAVDADGMVYVADTFNHRIRKITPAGVVSLLAGSTAGDKDGTGAEAQFNTPFAVAVDSTGTVYVAERDNHRIRKITPAGVVSLLAGSGTAGSSNGTGAAAQFDTPTGVAVGADGTIYVADKGNHQIRKITPRQVNK